MEVIHKESEERCGVIVALLGYDFFIGTAPNKKFQKILWLEFKILENEKSSSLIREVSKAYK